MTAPDVTPRRRFAPRHLAWVGLFLVAVACVVIVARLGTSETGGFDGGRVERLIPLPGSKILQQDIVGIDMAPGYESTLTINGVPIPLDQSNVIGPINQTTFKPGPGKVFEQFPAGQNCAVATYWQSSVGPSVTSTRSWCFTVV